jgi:hypothetical protein
MIGNNPQKGLLLLDCTFVVALGSKNVTQQEVHLRALIFRVESPKPTCTYFGRSEIGLVEVSCGAIEVSDRIAERIQTHHFVRESDNLLPSLSSKSAVCRVQ